MNELEFKRLRDCPGLSHAARSLYIFYLRPLADRVQVRTDLYQLSNVLSSDSINLPFRPDIGLCARLLDELELAGLIKRQQPHAPWQGALLTFPCFEAQSRQLPTRPFRMHDGWLPSANFRQEALICGLTDPEYSASDLQAFIAYWQGKYEVRNQHAWERAFIQRLLRRRQAGQAQLSRQPQNERTLQTICADVPELKAEGFKE